MVLIGPFAHVGIALATALSNWANVALLALLSAPLRPSAGSGPAGAAGGGNGGRLPIVMAIVLLARSVHLAPRGRSNSSSCWWPSLPALTTYLAAVQLAGGTDLRELQDAGRAWAAELRCTADARQARAPLSRTRRDAMSLPSVLTGRLAAARGGRADVSRLRPGAGHRRLPVGHCRRFPVDEPAQHRRL